MFKDNIWREFVGNIAAENMDDEIELKLNDTDSLKDLVSSNKSSLKRLW